MLNEQSIITRKNESLLYNPKSKFCIKIEEYKTLDLYCGIDVTADKPPSESGKTDNDPCGPGLIEEPKDFNFNKDASLNDM